MGVSKNRGTPKWMVYNGKPYEQMDDLGVPLCLETPTSLTATMWGLLPVDKGHTPRVFEANCSGHRQCGNWEK